MSSLFVLFQYVLPQHLLSRIVGKLANGRFLKNFLIRIFIRRYKVDMSEALVEDPTAFENFNAFFTRELKQDARPIASEINCIISPADGAISQLGDITGDKIFQAKGREFSLQQLLGGNNALAESFLDGKFMTVYLSPRDYHRVHLPLAANLLRSTYIPGSLFSVNTVTTEKVRTLFARNERYVMEFETAVGPMAVIMVGAMIVAGIETVWSGRVCPLPGKREISQHDYTAANPPIQFATGAEIARFKLGSTVIMLFPRGAMSWDSTLKADTPLRMGQLIGHLQSS